MPTGQANPSSTTQEARWDFLKGSGPSSALYYYAPLEKEGQFKPGWNTKRPQALIQQDVERKIDEAYREQRLAAATEVRRERLQDAQRRNRFNPISHQSLDADGSWRQATDAWQHQRVGVRAQDPRFAAAEILQKREDVMRRNVGITELRKDRIANGGLSKHPGGTMKEVLTWGGGQ